MHLRRCQPSETADLCTWIIDHHYLHSVPPAFRLALEFLTDDQTRVGAMLLGCPNARALPSPPWLELTRMIFLNEMPRNTESHALGMMRRHVRKWLPDIRMLLAYSDPSVGHTGTVYRADGWVQFGTTKRDATGWGSRPGRRAGGSTSQKLRWLRSP
jgi:hypothetical protein